MPEMSDAVPLPENPFAPFSASITEPWDVRRASHLLRRGALAATNDRLTDALKRSSQEAVDALFAFDASDDPLGVLQEQLVGFFNPNRLESQQEWWLYRIVNTTHPLQERIALLWHNHFATSASKVQNLPLLANQINLFRRKGLGSFRELLSEVSRDPAMLIWLDGNSNRKGAANENYGREVMELFTLGIGTYTEQDVKELARAFTGWHIDGEKAVFNKANFDDGEKTIFGQTGRFDSENAVDLLLGHPAAPKHLARRLLRQFVHPDPTDEQIAHYADRLIAQKWEIRPVLREMLGSRLFFSDWAYRSKIKSPVELTTASVVSLGGKASMTFLREQTNKMGQSLLMPPNVKGWDGEEAWINANTVLLRFNFGLTLAAQRGDSFARRADLEGWLHEHSLKTAEDIVDHYTRLFLDSNVTAAARAELLDFMNHGTKNEPKPFVLTPETMNTKVRGILHLMMAMPEFQLA